MNPGRNWWIGAAVVLAALWVSPRLASETGGPPLVSDRVNGVHRDLAPTIAPLELGPLTVKISSPAQILEVFEHELWLEPAGHDETARLRAKYQGQAELVAELMIGDAKTQLTDQIEIPLQETELSGRVHLERDAAGYRVTTIELPDHVEVEVRSGLGAQLAPLCRGMSVISMGGVDCDALARSLSRLRLPLPDPGRSYFLDDASLTETERRQIDAYLGRRRAAGGQEARSADKPAREAASTMWR